MQSPLSASLDGCPLELREVPVLLHQNTDSESSNTVYVFAYPTSDAVVDLTLTTESSEQVSTVATRRLALPSYGASCVLQGCVLAPGTRLFATSAGGSSAALGYSIAAPCIPVYPAAKYVLHHMVFGEQTLALHDSRTVTLDANLPLCTLHLHTAHGRVQLPVAAVGTMKHIVVATRAVPSGACFVELASGSVGLSRVGDALAVLCCGKSWIALNYV